MQTGAPIGGKSEQNRRKFVRLNLRTPSNTIDAAEGGWANFALSPEGNLFY